MILRFIAFIYFSKVVLKTGIAGPFGCLFRLSFLALLRRLLRRSLGRMGLKIRFSRRILHCVLLIVILGAVLSAGEAFLILGLSQLVPLSSGRETMISNQLQLKTQANSAEFLKDILICYCSSELFPQQREGMFYQPLQKFPLHVSFENPSNKTENHIHYI